jgi:hypothetical protein
MDNGKFWLVIVAIAIGYFWGKSGSGNDVSGASSYQAIDHSANTTDFQDEKVELKRKLEEARSDLEDAVSSADDAEFLARMRWVETGRTEDFIRLNAAEDAASAAQNSLDNLESN